MPRSQRKTSVRKTKLSAKLAAVLTYLYFSVVRKSMRLHVVNDRRVQVTRDSDRQYIYAILHAHQVAAVALSEPGVGALVSRSRDGDILVPLLKACNLVPIRGSSGQGRKGGATALSQLIRHVENGNAAVLAVDGPKGPRGQVQNGAAMLAQKTGVPILPVVLVPSRRFTFKKAWDRMQLPLPFCQLACRFAEPIYVTAHDDLDAMSMQVQQSLATLESIVDPKEAAIHTPSQTTPQAHPPIATQQKKAA